MVQRHPDAAALPPEIAIFPLAGALLLPRGKLPLNIFEPRYVAMTEDALASGRMIGMIQPDPSAQPGSHGPALFKVGCLGKLSSWSESDDGRFLITLDGLSRFTVVEELWPARGYRRVRASYAGFEEDLLIDPPPAMLPRDMLIAELKSYFKRGGMDANWDAVDRLSDDALLIALCMICPFPPAEKQALLEAPDDAARADTLILLLRMGGPASDDDEERTLS